MGFQPLFTYYIRYYGLRQARESLENPTEYGESPRQIGNTLSCTLCLPDSARSATGLWQKIACAKSLTQTGRVCRRPAESATN